MDFPVFLRLAGKLCVVVGSGPVGKRKAQSLLHAGALVRVISPDAPWEDRAGAVEWVQGRYRPIYLTGAFLVCAAGPPLVNACVVADAKRGNIWVNSATEPETGDFTIPAVAAHGRIQVAVSTSGASPILARRVAGSLGEKVDPAWVQWVDLLAEFRPAIRAKIADDDRRTDLLTDLCDLRWLMMIESEGAAVARGQMADLVRAALGETR